MSKFFLGLVIFFLTIAAITAAAPAQLPTMTAMMTQPPAATQPAARAAVDESIRDMLGHLIKWSIMGFGLVVACNQIGIQIAALLTAAGVIGLAVGFAAQETLANFIAGIVIFWDKPFRVGDWLEIEETY